MLIIVFVLFVVICEIYSANKSMRRTSLLGGKSRKSVKSSKRHKPTITKVDELSADGTPNITRLNITNAPQEIAKLIPNHFPQVGVLTNEVIHKFGPESFVWLEKTDGEHKNIIIFKDKIYHVTFNALNVLPTVLNDSYAFTVLDSELYKDMYYIFDAAYVEGVDVSKLPFIERMDAADKFIKKHAQLSQIFEIKKFYPVTVDVLGDLVNRLTATNISPETGNRIDGFVLQHKNLPYFHEADYISYKLKRRNLNTIDFKVHYDSDDCCYYLYLVGSFKECIFNRKQLPRDNEFAQKHENVDLYGTLPDKLYILFASSFFEGLHVYAPDLDYDHTGYFEDEITTINQITTDMDAHPDKYNTKIVEFSLTNSNSWVPMRMREDKRNSNGYAVGLSNCAVMFNPITPESIRNESLYFTKSTQLAFDKSIIDPYHSINRIIRQHIIEANINNRMSFKLPRGASLSVLDLAGGRGADELYLYHAGVGNIFAMDADKTALVQYVSRTQKTPLLKWAPLDGTCKQPQSLPRVISINAIHGVLGENNQPIIDDIKQRYEFPAMNFDIILMNYAYHYLCGSMQSLKELHRTVCELLRPNGLFIFTYFDGEAIAEVSKSNIAHIGPFSIEILSDGSAKMPLPTIDSSGYRREPLVMKKHLAVFTKSKSFKLLTNYAPFEKVENYYDEDEDPQHVAEFISFIRVMVLERVA